MRGRKQIIKTYSMDAEVVEMLKNIAETEYKTMSQVIRDLIIAKYDNLHAIKIERKTEDEKYI